MKLGKTFGLALFVTAFSSVAFAGNTVPELDPGIVSSAMLVLGGLTLIVRSRRKK